MRIIMLFLLSLLAPGATGQSDEEDRIRRNWRTAEQRGATYEALYKAGWNDGFDKGWDAAKRFCARYPSDCKPVEASAKEKP